MVAVSSPRRALDVAAVPARRSPGDAHNPLQPRAQRADRQRAPLARRRARDGGRHAGPRSLRLAQLRCPSADERAGEARVRSLSPSPPHSRIETSSVQPTAPRRRRGIIFQSPDPEDVASISHCQSVSVSRSAAHYCTMPLSQLINNTVVTYVVTSQTVTDTDTDE
jgi:hypothetical protein